MEEQFSRISMLLGEEALDKLFAAKVLVVGIGGVGGYALEALARTGIGEIAIVDGDTFNKSNLNRQIYATYSSLGRPKVEVARERIADINSYCKVVDYHCYYTEHNAHSFDLQSYDYIVDAIDSAKDKILLIKNAQNAGVRIISCMGAGRRLLPTALVVGDIYKTQGCPFAKKMRKLCEQNGIKQLRVVYSLEPSMKNKQQPSTPFGSLVFVPATAGMILAGEVTAGLIGSLDNQNE